MWDYKQYSNRDTEKKQAEGLRRNLKGRANESNLKKLFDNFMESMYVQLCFTLRHFSVQLIS